LSANLVFKRVSEDHWFVLLDEARAFLDGEAGYIGVGHRVTRH